MATLKMLRSHGPRPLRGVNRTAGTAPEVCEGVGAQRRDTSGLDCVLMASVTALTNVCGPGGRDVLDHVVM